MKIELKEEWLRKILPDGFPYPSSTLVSGPGGTGKPLIVLGFVANWLRNGKKAVGVQLQYATMDFVREVMSALYGLDISNYEIKFIQFDPFLEKYEEQADYLKANLLKPEVWDYIIDKYVDEDTMLFASALNLLLFSKTYKDKIWDKLDAILKSPKGTYIFSVSTNVFRDLIKRWEDSSDNLMFTRMERPGKLFLRIERMKDVKFSKEEIEIPISPNVLKKIKDVAERARTRIIPIVSRI